MLHKIEVKFFKFSIYCTVDNNVKRHDLVFRTYGWHVEVKSEFFHVTVGVDLKSVNS